MKQFQDYKKQFNVFIVFLLLIIPAFFVYAQTAEELNQKIDSRNTDIQNLEKEIAAYQQQLDSLGKQSSSLSVLLKQLDLTKKKLTADIAVTQNKISNKNTEIQKLSGKIDDTKDVIKNNTDTISLSIKQINEFEIDSMVEKLFSKDDISTIWNDIDNLISLQGTVKNKILELKDEKKSLEKSKNVTEKARNELVYLKIELADQKKIVDQNTNEKNKLLKQTKETNFNFIW